MAVWLCWRLCGGKIWRGFGAVSTHDEGTLHWESLEPGYCVDTYEKRGWRKVLSISLLIFVYIRFESAPSSLLSMSRSRQSIPMHPHIYSNGIICLDLLDRQGWSPVHNVESVCVSLQSMLTSNTQNERPPNDDVFVRHNTQRPRDIKFVFHDNAVRVNRYGCTCNADDK